MKIISTVTAVGIMSAVALFASPVAHAESKQTDKKKEPEQVIVTVNEGDSLTSIAEAHKTDYVRIFNANDSIANPDAINPGDKVRIPRADEELPDRFSQYQATVVVAATPVATGGATTTNRQYSSAPINSNSYYVGNGMWCTDWVYSKRSDLSGYGNAGYNWISSAQAQGKATGSTPQVGAVAVTNGHVAYVTGVNGDGSYNVSEMGWNYQAGGYNERTVKPGTFGAFIY